MKIEVTHIEDVTILKPIKLADRVILSPQVF